MPDAGEQAPFLDDGRRSVVRAQDLQRDVAFENRIPRQIHRAETATADFTADLEASPGVRNTRALGDMRREGLFCRNPLMSLSHTSNDLQLSHDRLLV